MQNNLLKTEKMPLVSIITVVFNSELFIEKTILSIINQNYANIEYIIVDGGSVDNTLEIIKKYERYISKWSSQKDYGIYDAMNKGIEMATGDYCWFINSGDEIFSETVLLEAFQKLDYLPDILYGETEIINYKGELLGLRRHSIPDKLSWKSFQYGMKVCHQSVIVKKSIIRKYDLHYQYSSDFDWLIDILKRSVKIHNTGLILSKFMQGGQTSRTLLPGLKERFRIMVKYYGLFRTIFNHILLGLKLIFYYLKNRRI